MKTLGLNTEKKENKSEIKRDMLQNKATGKIQMTIQNWWAGDKSDSNFLGMYQVQIID